MDVEGVRPLLARHWYDAIAAVLAAHPQGRGDARLAAAQRYATAAKRVLDLDAEDFGQIAAGFEREEWKRDLLDACFPGNRHAKTSERLREGRRPARGLAFAAIRGGRLVGTLR